MPQGCYSNRRIKFPDHIKKIFLFNTKNIRHFRGTKKIVLLENTKIFQSQMTLIKFPLLMTKRGENDHFMFLYMTGYPEG